MGVLGSVWQGIVAVLAFIWDLFTDWLFLFISPVNNFDALWILIPIYIAWILTEFFQEKDRTSFGNAIANGVVPLWASIDWTRYLIATIKAENLGFSGMLFLKFSICAAVFAYGAIIIIDGIRAKSFIHYFGRIREISYVMIMVTPAVYGAVTLTWKYLLAVLVFFPLFYFVVQWIDEHTPAPPSLQIDQGEESGKRYD